MRTNADIRCPVCKRKFEPIFTFGLGHKEIYDESCVCGEDFRVEKIIYSKDYFGTTYIERYIIHGN